MPSSSTRLRTLVAGTALATAALGLAGPALAQTSVPPSSTTTTTSTTSTTIATTTTTADPCAPTTTTTVDTLPQLLGNELDATAPPCTTTTTAAVTTTSQQAPGTTSTTQASTTTTTAPANPALTVSPNVLTIGQAFTLSSNGWKPGSAVVVTLNSTPVTLGTLVADQVGNVTGTFSVPTGFSLGAHTVQLDGLGLAGSVQVLSASVTIVAAAQAATTTTTATTGSLPTTGSDAVRLVGIGALLLGAGATALVVRRRVTS